MGPLNFIHLIQVKIQLSTQIFEQNCQNLGKNTEKSSKNDPTENKVIGTCGQGVRVWCPRELTTEHLTEPSLRLD